MGLRELGILLWGEVLLELSLAKGRQAEIQTTRDDPAIERWLSVDPKTHWYPSHSPGKRGNTPLEEDYLSVSQSSTFTDKESGKSIKIYHVALNPNGPCRK